MSIQPVISVSHVNFFYGAESILSDVCLDVMPGDFMGIIGPNGGGKTTLLKLVLGLIVPQSGTIGLFGQSPLISRSRAGYIPQETSINKTFPVSVFDVVCMGLLGLRKPGHPFTKDDYGIVHQTMETLTITALKNKKIGDLSGGQRQKVFLARALVAQPEVLFLDEPTASIDATGQDEIYKQLDVLNKSGVTVCLITHNIATVSKFIRSIACVNHELYFHPDGVLTEHSVHKTFGCAVDLIAHGLPHRVYHPHGEGP